ncbi:MAG: hypothetical protein OMM_07562, partial [Candidatus Magnetoglobus multicellularis str. Araruama]
MKRYYKSILKILSLCCLIYSFNSTCIETTKDLSAKQEVALSLSPDTPSTESKNFSTIPCFREDGIALDRHGTMYVIDKLHSQIWKVTSEKKASIIAGNGLSGFSGDGGLAVNASLNHPEQIIVDHSGIIYISDTLNHRIRKIDNGIINTVVGNGTPGYSGDGNHALSSSLNHPTGIAVASQNIIYIADKYNHRIRKVDQYDIITTIAGTGVEGNTDSGLATEASLYLPDKIIITEDQRLLFLENIFFASENASNHQLIKEITTVGMITEPTRNMEPITIENNYIARMARTAPSEPINLTFIGEKNLIALTMSWEYSGQQFDYFQILRQIEKNENLPEWKIIVNRLSEKTFTDGSGENPFTPGDIYSYGVKACLLNGGCSSMSNTITHTFENHPPLILNIPDYSINESQIYPVYFMGCDVETHAADLDGSVTATNLTLFPSDENLSIKKCDGGCATQTLWLTPATHISGESILTVTLTDGDKYTSTEFTVTVNPMPNTPTISSFYTYIIPEDQKTLISMPFNITDYDQITTDINGKKYTITETVTITPECSALTRQIFINDEVIITGYDSPDEHQVITKPGNPRNLTLTIFPIPNANGSADITITAFDSDNLTTEESFRFIITPVNDYPVIVDTIDSRITKEDVPLTNVTIRIEDIDSNSLTITSCVSDPNLVTVTGIVFYLSDIDSNNSIISHNNVYTITNKQASESITATIGIDITPVTNAFSNPDPVTILINVSDGELLTTISFSLHITEDNDPPVLSDIQIQSTKEDMAVSLSFQLSDVEGSNQGEFIIKTNSSDPGIVDASKIEYSGLYVISADEGYSVSVAAQETRTITMKIKPEPNMSGPVQISITVQDSSVFSEPESFTLTVNPVNDKPVLSGLFDQTIDEDDKSHSVSLALTDVDINASHKSDLTVTATSSNPSLVIDTNICSDSTNDCGIPWILDMKNKITTSLKLNVVPLPNIPWSTEYTETEITIRVSDALTSISGSYTLTVKAKPDAPTITSISPQTVDEDTINYPVAFSIADNDGSSVTITVHSSNHDLLPESNLSFKQQQIQSIPLQAIGIPHTLTMFLSPTANQPTQTTAGSTITLTVTDQTGLSQTTSFEFNVQPVNDPPVFGDITCDSMDEDTTSYACSFTVVDVDFDTLSLSYTSANETLFPNDTNNIAFILNENEVYTINATPGPQTISLRFHPEQNEWGNARITVRIEDHSIPVEQNLTMTVNPVNDSPLLSLSINEMHLESGVPETVSFTVVDVDIESLTITYEASLPNLLDGVHFSGENVFFHPDGYTMNADRTAKAGLLSFTPSDHHSSGLALTITVTDIAGSSAKDTLALSIKDRPDIGLIDNVTTSEDSMSCGHAFTILDADPEQLTMTIHITNSDLVPFDSLKFSDNLQGTENIYTFASTGDPTDITFCYTPPRNLNGSSTVTLTVKDLLNWDTSRSFDIIVQPEPDAPTIVEISNQSVDEDKAKDITVKIGDADADALTVIALASNQVIVPYSRISWSVPYTNIALDDQNSREITLSIAPENNRFGQTEMSVTVVDGSGLSNSVSFTLTVHGTADAPTINYLSVISSQSNPWHLTEDENVPQVNLSVSDVDGATLTVQYTSITATVIPITNISLDGKTYSTTVIVSEIATENSIAELPLNITLPENVYGRTRIDIIVTDETNKSVEKSIYIDISPVNDVPAISTIANFTIGEHFQNEVIGFNVEDIDGDDLYIFAESGNTSVINGQNIVFAYSVSTNEYFWFKPETFTASPSQLTLSSEPNQSGPVSITVTVKDRKEGDPDLQHFSTSFQITVNGAPDFTDIEPYETPENTLENQEINYTIGQISIADKEGNPYTLTIDEYSVADVFYLTSNNWITLSQLVDHEIINEYTLKVKVEDAYNESYTTVTIKIADVQEPPTVKAAYGYTQTLEDESIVLSITVGDPDGDALTATVMSSITRIVSNESIIFDGSGSNVFKDISLTNFYQDVEFTVTPNPDQFSHTVLSITVMDASGRSDQIDITLTVIPMPDPPTITNIEYLELPHWIEMPDEWTLNEEQIVPQVRFSVADVDGGALTIITSSINCILPSDSVSLGLTQIYLSPGQSVSIPLWITLPVNAIGETGLTLTALGTDGLSSTNQINITIQNNSDPPMISASVKTYTIAENTTSISIPFSVSDVDGDKLYLDVQSGNTSIINVSSASYENFTPTDKPQPKPKKIDDACLVKYEIIDVYCVVEPEKNQYGSVPLTITVKDNNNNNGLEDDVHVTVNINGAPDFSIPESLNLSENNEIGYTVAQITVSDPESNSCAITITDSSHTGIFHIETGQKVGNQYTVTIIADVETNFEDIKEYTLTILAQDTLNKSYTTVDISIQDVLEAPSISITQTTWATNEDISITESIHIGDPDGDPLTVVIMSSNTNLVSTESISISGSVSYTLSSIQLSNYEQILPVPVTVTPLENQNDEISGNTFLSITVTDKTGLSDNISITF